MATLAVAVAMLAALSPARASAHGALRRSEPARGAHLDVAPRVVRLTFSERPELRFTSIELVGPDSAPVALGPLRLDSARTVTADVRGPLAGGVYTVVWQMAGDDGHPVRGRYTFVIAPGARGLAPPPPAQGEPAGNVAAPAQQAPPAAHHRPVSVAGGDDVFGAESPLYVAIRWLLYAALLSVLGVVAFRLAVLPVLGRRSPGARSTELTERASARSAAIGVTASLALAATVVARLLAQSYAMHGPAHALDAGFVAAMLWWTVWGWGWLLQLVGVVLALAGFLRARRGHAAGWRLAAFGALLLAFTPALSGHAASSPRLTGLAVLADGLHVIGAGGWLGSLLVALAAGVPAALALGEGERGTAVRDLIDAFSPTALAFASLVAVTGLFAGWLHLGSLPALWRSDYGRTLLVKLAVLFLLAGAGAYNWLRARRALGDLRGARRMRSSATVELALGAVVLLVTAVLVATPTPAEATDERTAQVATPVALAALGDPAAAQAPADSAAVAAVVERYHHALAEGDSVAALALLGEDAVILESGDVESRAEYRAHHLPADIAFARAVKGTRSPVRVTVRGDVAWAHATSTTTGQFRGRAVNSVGAELMVLTRAADGWKISAIHWSSHKRQS